MAPIPEAIFLDNLSMCICHRRFSSINIPSDLTWNSTLLFILLYSTRLSDLTLRHILLKALQACFINHVWYVYVAHILVQGEIETCVMFDSSTQWMPMLQTLWNLQFNTLKSILKVPLYGDFSAVIRTKGSEAGASWWLFSDFQSVIFRMEYSTVCK